VTHLVGNGLGPPLIWIPAVVVAVAMLLPPLYLVLSVTKTGTDILNIFRDPDTIGVIGNTVLLMVTVSIGAVLIALPIAWLTIKTDLPLRRMWSVLTILPLVIPSYVGGFIVITAFGPKGLLQNAMSPLGVDRLPEIYGFPGAFLTLTILSFPYVLLPLRASLYKLDPSIEESSNALGMGAWNTFIKVTLPMLRPSMVIGGLIVALYTISDFGAVSMLQYETFTWSIYVEYESAFDRIRAAALAIILVTMAAILIYVESRTRNLSRYYVSGSGSPRSIKRYKLNAWKGICLILCSIVVTVSLFIPVSVLIYWATRVVSTDDLVSNLMQITVNSVYSSFLAAFFATGCGIFIAVFAVRYPSRISALIERLSYVSFALPGIVVAMALVYFGIHYVRPVYQTMVILVFSYVVLFLPLSVGPIRNSLLQVNPKIEEAARSLGKTNVKVLGSITLPLVSGGVFAGASLVFLLTMKELPATLILGPLGFKTLATYIWSAAEEAFLGYAALGSLILIFSSAIPMTWITLRGEKW